jgi:YtcA family
LLPVTVSGCGGNVNLFGIYFAPWMACVAAGALFGYAATRLLERHVFDYDPRYFAWTFLALTVLFSFGFWLAVVRG